MPDLEIEAIDAIGELSALAEGARCVAPVEPLAAESGVDPDEPDLCELRGQPVLRGALELAAAGAHNLLIVGPPGAGKSMAARRLPSLMPPLRHEEAIEVRRIAGVAGISQPPGVIARRPFRAPHHTISAAGLVGGGNPVRPGEITLAHRGVLFLDELAEFNRAALEALRQPLEAARVTIARASGAISFPTAFQLVAAANPCPCGHGAADPRCSCPPGAIDRYRARLSGALADRIDISVTVGQPDAAALASDEPEPSAPVRERVVAARAVQEARYGPGLTNAAVGDAQLRKLSRPTPGALEMLAGAQRSHGLSGRGWARVLRLARTGADLEGEEEVGERQVAAALSLRGRVAR